MVDEKQQLEERISELENNWKRALADYKNLEKRLGQEKAEFVKFANQVLISKLLFVLDSLEMVQKHSDDKGLDLIIKEFSQILVDEGLEEIESLSKPFDEDTMEAIELVSDPEKDGKVVEVLQKGYKLRNKVLRPARVKVGTINKVNEEEK